MVAAVTLLLTLLLLSLLVLVLVLMLVLLPLSGRCSRPPSVVSAPASLSPARIDLVARPGLRRRCC